MISDNVIVITRHGLLVTNMKLLAYAYAWRF
jgi:hypothetical protein